MPYIFYVSYKTSVSLTSSKAALSIHLSSHFQMNYRHDFRSHNIPLKYIIVGNIPGHSSLWNYIIYILFKLQILGRHHAFSYPCAFTVFWHNLARNAKWHLTFIQILFQNTVPISQKTLCSHNRPVCMCVCVDNTLSP